MPYYTAGFAREMLPATTSTSFVSTTTRSWSAVSRWYFKNLDYMRPCFMLIFFATALLQHYFTVHFMKIALPSQAKNNFWLSLAPPSPELILCSLLPLEFGWCPSSATNRWASKQTPRQCPWRQAPSRGSSSRKPPRFLSQRSSTQAPTQCATSVPRGF